jgi:hypothetical protein
MKQFVYEGDYTQYRGYVFAYGKPTTVTDKGTISELDRHPHFKEFNREEKAPETTPPEVLKAPDPYACPKCGKHVKQGHYMHVKWCKG